MNLTGRNFLKLLDYTPEEIRYLLDLSKDLKNKKKSGISHKYLPNKNIVLLFEKLQLEQDVLLKLLHLTLVWE